MVTCYGSARLASFSTTQGAVTDLPTVEGDFLGVSYIDMENIELGALSVDLVCFPQSPGSIVACSSIRVMEY